MFVCFYIFSYETNGNLLSELIVLLCESLSGEPLCMGAYKARGEKGKWLPFLIRAFRKSLITESSRVVQRHLFDGTSDK